MRKMVKKFAKWFFYIVASFGFACFLLFYVFIVSGKAPLIQELWVTSAMTTLNHKWLATAFIPDDVINDIMHRTYVNDDGMDTILEDVNHDVNIYEDNYTGPSIDEMITEIPDDLIPQPKVDLYIEEQGYTQLDNSLYMKEVSGDLWKGYIMMVADPSRVRLTDTSQQGVCGQTVMGMVQDAGAIAGINGGGFNDGPNYDSNGGSVSGILIIDGEVVNPTYSEENIIGLSGEGKLVLKHGSSDWAINNNIQYAVAFSPFLIVNGEGTIKSGTGGWGIAPRTALGQRETGEILFLVIDGRQVGYSVGVDIRVLQDTLLAEGCVNAAMMDGGSSTVMVYNGEYVNKPSLGHERRINNCWIIMPER